MSDVFIITHSGIKFDLLDPKPEMVVWDDIAWALPRINRFTGHTTFPYSVAQHTFLGAREIRDHALAAEFLLHDASEAYLGDMNSPLKSLCPGYRKIEYQVDAVIRERFGLPRQPALLCKETDMRMLATEKRDLMPQAVDDWPCLDGFAPFSDRICEMSERTARNVFRAMFSRLFPAGAEL